MRRRGAAASSGPALLAAVAAVVLGVALLGGCGFEPLYGRDPMALPAAEGAPPPPDVQPVRAELAAVRVVGPGGGRLGQILRNDLLDLLNPTGAEVPPAYDLVVRLRRDSQALAVQLDNTVTRFNLILGADFQLRRAADGQPVYGSFVRRVASYNVRGQPFATLIAERDAERRAARAVSEDIVTQLAVLFRREAEADADAAHGGTDGGAGGEGPA